MENPSIHVYVFFSFKGMTVALLFIKKCKRVPYPKIFLEQNSHYTVKKTCGDYFVPN